MTPKEAVELLDKYYDNHPMSGYGPCHIVIADYNLRDSDILWCIQRIDEVLESGSYVTEYKFLDKYEIIAERAFMLDLLEIPEIERDYWGWFEQNEDKQE